MVPAITKALGLVLIMFAFPLTLAAGPIEPILQPASSTPTTVQPTATPIITFDGSTIGEFTTCTSANIPWLPVGALNLPIMLSISNVGIYQTEPPSISTSTSGSSGSKTFSSFVGTATAILAHDGSTTVTIAPSVDPSLGRYTWSTVNVSQGWYAFTAQTMDTNLTAAPPIRIFVRNGTDTSCLSSGSSPSSLNTPQSNPSPTPTTSVSTSSSPAPSTKTKAIIGGAVGGVAFIAILVGLIFLLYKRKRSRQASSSTSIYTTSDLPSTSTVSPFVLQSDPNLSSKSTKAHAVYRTDSQVVGRREDVVASVQPEVLPLREAASDGDSDDFHARFQAISTAMAQMLEIFEARFESEPSPPPYPQSQLGVSWDDLRASRSEDNDN